MRQFRTPHTYEYDKQNGFQTTKPSQTVPDQSLTLRELLLNYTRGGHLPQSETTPAFFDENSFIPNLKGMDLTEIQELMEANAKNAVLLQQQYNILQQPIVIQPTPTEGTAKTD